MDPRIKKPPKEEAMRSVKAIVGGLMIAIVAQILPAAAPRSAMSSPHTPSPRAKCQITEGELQEIVKYELRKLGQLWASADQEVVLKTYASFFLEVAKRTERLNATPLQKAIVHVHGTGKEMAKKIAQSLAGAFQYAHRKTYSTESGAKLSPLCKALVDVWGKMNEKGSSDACDLEPAGGALVSVINVGADAYTCASACAHVLAAAQAACKDDGAACCIA